jgi:hypothetical protein
MAIQNKTRAKEGTKVTVSYSDSINLVKKQVQWSPKGVSLLTKWPFRVGAEVEFAFDHLSERHCCTGVVVECHPAPRQAGFYETVLFFVETPCSALQKAASDCQLAREQSDGHDGAPASSGDGAAPSPQSSASPPRSRAQARR